MIFFFFCFGCWDAGFIWIGLSWVISMWLCLVLFGDLIHLPVIFHRADLFGRASQHQESERLRVGFDLAGGYFKDLHITGARFSWKGGCMCGKQGWRSIPLADVCRPTPWHIMTSLDCQEVSGCASNFLALQRCLGRPDGIAVNSHDWRREIRLKKDEEGMILNISLSCFGPI